MGSFAAYWKELLGSFSAIAAVILGFLWIEDRYSPDGAIAAVRAEILVNVEASHADIIKQIKIGDFNDQIATMTLMVADITGVIARYDMMEETEELTQANRVRRDVLTRQKADLVGEIGRLSNLREQLK